MTTDNTSTYNMDGPLSVDLCRWWREHIQKAYRTDIFDGPLFPLQRPREQARMMSIARTVEPKVIMEIGADKGGSIYHWCTMLPSVERVIACEIRGTPYSAIFEEAFPNKKFLWLPRSSYNASTIEEVAKWLDSRSIDCLFIDGDKSFFDLDFALYLRFMRSPDGIVFMHDIQDPTTGAAFDKCKHGRKWVRLIDTTESVEVIERARQGIRPRTEHEDWLRQWRGESCGVGVIYL